MIYECMWHVSSGLKEDEEGNLAGGPGYPPHPLSILMRLATYIYISYTFIAISAASWHKS